MTKVPLQPQDKYVLRLPDGMRDRIKRAAEKNKRSMNAEIIAALAEAYPNQYSLSEWLGDWLPKLMNVQDASEREALAKQALDAAKGMGFRPEIEFSDDGGVTKPTIVFRPHLAPAKRRRKRDDE